MTEHSIYFPHLHILFKYVPKSFMIGNYRIAFYGIIIAVGIIVAELFVLHEAKRTGQDQETYLDLTIWGVIFGIIGARIYYVAFSWDYYSKHLNEIIKIHSGGMAIYGSVIAAILTCFVLCRIKKLQFWKVCDTACMGLLIGQIFGRWGNFMNREAFGEYTDSLFAMLVPLDAVNRPQDITENMMAHLVTQNGIDCISVHPTFLYESLWNLGVFILLLFFRDRKKFEGQLFFLYMGLYGVGRFWIEGLRTDQLQVGDSGVAISQVLGLVLFFASAAIIIICLLLYREGNLPAMFRKGVSGQAAKADIAPDEGVGKEAEEKPED